MAPLSREGAPPPAAGPLPDVDLVELGRRLAAGEWAVDLRPRGRFAAGHLAGAVNVEGIAAAATYVGWLLPWGTPVSLIGADEATLETARVALSRIGVEPQARHLVDEGWTDEGWPSFGYGVAGYPVETFAGLAAARARDRSLLVLDVRKPPACGPPSPLRSSRGRAAGPS